MTTNELLEDLDFVKTHEMKHLEEMHFEIVMLERIKNSLDFEMNVLKTELKEKTEILEKKMNVAENFLKEVNESEQDFNGQKILKIVKALINQTVMNNKTLF